MTGMGQNTAVVTRKGDVGQATTNDGHFASKEFGDDTVTLTLLPGEELRPMSSAETKALVENAFVGMDAALLDEETSEDAAERIGAESTAAAHAEVAAYILGDEIIDRQKFARELLDDRRRGDAVELEPTWSGPGELPAVRRQQVAEYFRDRANTLFARAMSSTATAEAAARDIAAYDVFDDAANSMSTTHDYYTGE